MYKKYKNIIGNNITIIEALKVMNSCSMNLLIAINKEKLIGIISIGDIRRAILKGIDINITSIQEVMRDKILVAKEDDSLESIKKTMFTRKIECMPIVDELNNLKNVLYWQDVFSEKKTVDEVDADVVIMAGGLGTRLKPITNIIPKPLIPIGEKTIIEIIIDNFMRHNISNYYISVNYKAKMIEDYLKNKESNKCRLNYFTEDKPLGTIGSLSLIKERLNKTIFVSNCDILIEEDYSEIYKYHKENKNDITIVSALKHLSIPYGVLKTEEGGQLISMSEKPEFTFQINTGMYVLESHILDLIPNNEFYHITDLIDKVNINGKVGVFPIPEKSWHDIGQWKEYSKTIQKYTSISIDI